MADLVKHVIKCLNRANLFQTKLSQEIVSMEGMSGLKTRIFYNELCSLIVEGRDTEYLEVGTWKGSTVCSALWENPNCRGTVIENWALFGGPRDEFNQNIDKARIKDRLQIFEEDVFAFDISKLSKPIDIYLYDGDHDQIHQYKGITHIWKALADQAVIIVDDWNAPHIREGTLDALRDVGANVVERFEITYMLGNEVHTPMPIAHREFWNGMGVFVISKI
jgi:hypothetical protein